MAKTDRKTKRYTQLPWTGGINNTVDAGILDPQYAVRADGILPDTGGSKSRRGPFVYFDSNIPAPDKVSKSSGTVTLKWLTNILVNNSAVSTTNDRLVSGEKITVTSTNATEQTNFGVTATAISSLTNVAEVTDVTFIADVGGNLHNKYFLISSAENATKYLCYIDIDGSGTAPTLSGYTQVQIDVTGTGAGATASQIASAAQTALNALTPFSATVSTDTVTVTNAQTGIVDAPSDAGGSGVTFDVTTEGGHTLTYTGPSGPPSEANVIGITVKRSSAYARVSDYWYFSSNTKNQVRVAASTQFKLFKYDGTGARDEITGSGGPSGAVNRINEVIFNNKLILSFDVYGDSPIVFDGTGSTYAALGGSPPDFAFATTHLNRIWTNDKDNPDRLHYSATGDHEKWNGADDSGALDLIVNDGDSTGITGIFSWRGQLFVGKSHSWYRITGFTPATFKIERISSGVGIESHNSIVAIDDTDVFHVSSRGVHAASATMKYGDVETSFISANIQENFNTSSTSSSFNSNRLAYTQTAYIPRLNAVVFTFSEKTENQNVMFVYHTLSQQWFRWPDVSCEALCSVRDGSRDVLFVGTADGRILELKDPTSNETEYTGLGAGFRATTGQVYPDNDPQKFKVFKTLTVYLKPQNKSDLTVNYQVDYGKTHGELIQAGASGDLLGSTFILGQSKLGSAGNFVPYSIPLKGIGRGIKLDFIQQLQNSGLEIWGYTIEFEEADLQHGVVPQ